MRRTDLWQFPFSGASPPISRTADLPALPWTDGASGPGSGGDHADGHSSSWESDWIDLGGEG